MNRALKILSGLRKDGYRLTGPRKNLVALILEMKGHWTIQDATREVKKKLKGVGVATLYRTIHLLAEHGILTETKVGTNAARYEVSSHHHHDHLTCKDCGKIFEFENDQIESLQAQIAKKLGFKLSDHRMELYGNCLKKDSCPHFNRARE